jgi:DnaD/phage-associated family protein
MIAKFEGFPEGKTSFVKIPDGFFTDLLPQIDHFGEIKVTLYIFWRLNRMEGRFRYLMIADFIEDSDFIQGLGESSTQAKVELEEGLKRCVTRGTLLKTTIKSEGEEEDLYFLNTPRGRAAVEAIEAGQWRPSGDPQMPIEIIQERPNIYRLYETNIGPLTPMIAETLRDAETTYPIVWIEEAIGIAVENNKRNWRYVQAILDRWKEGGRDEREDRRDTEKARRRYAEWESTDSSG